MEVNKLFDYDENKSKVIKAKYNITSMYDITSEEEICDIAEELLKDKIAVKIVEMNPKKANKFSEYLPNATIINADGSNEEILKEENFQNYDSCISITGIDEVNMFISIYAKKIGIKKINY